jgi:hypothetical protein
MTNYLDPLVIAEAFKMAQNGTFWRARRAGVACGGRSVGMTPIRSALKTGPPRSKGYRLTGRSVASMIRFGSASRADSAGNVYFASTTVPRYDRLINRHVGPLCGRDVAARTEPRRRRMRLQDVRAGQ